MIDDSWTLDIHIIQLQKNMLRNIDELVISDNIIYLDLDLDD